MPKLKPLQSAVDALLEQSGPIDKDAARVIRPAAPHDVWMPAQKPMAHKVESKNVLQVAPLPWNAKHMAEVFGRRRDRLQVIGYAAVQGSQCKNAKYVVRCDCGNFEHRTHILRWLGTQAPDMCRECRDRKYRLGNEWPRDSAYRATRPSVSKVAMPC